MNILMVYPESPLTFWSFKHALKFVLKKSSEPPLGLLTIAAMLPHEWNKKLIDLNVTKLKDKDILWADYVFLSGMDVHRESFNRIVEQSRKFGKKVVAGGPMCTMDYKSIKGVDHFILNEAEITLPEFIKDLKNGNPGHIYTSASFPDISKTPVPEWQLLDIKKYASMNIQYSRGCPFNCEFCSIALLNGYKVRTKNSVQFIAELQSLYDFGWRGSVFIVDDNFIGNRSKLKKEMLPALIDWSEKHKYPFSFITEVSINLADDDELIDLMVRAGFNSAFIGIETPNDESLAECGKSQNQHRNTLESIKKLHKKGIAVSGGFIVGFDHDTSSIFEKQIRFIQNSGIVTAMVGLLNAPIGTRLFNRLKSENRITQNRITGNNMDTLINFIPKMNYQKLVEGYKKIVTTIYSPKEYFERVRTFLNTYSPQGNSAGLSLIHIFAFFKAVWKLGLVERGRRFFWKLMFITVFKYPKKLSKAVTMAIYGYHFRRIADKI